jgi:hypothetical protein
MKQLFTSLLLFSFLCAVQAQEKEKKIRWMGKFEGRNAFVRTHHALFLGVRAGVELKFPIRLGVGYYWMQSHFDSNLYDGREYPDAGKTAQPRMRYAIAYAEYTFWQEDDWSLSVPVQMGFGETFYATDLDKHVANDFVMPLEAGIDVGYMFVRWAGIGVGLGYRVMLIDNAKVKENFNSPYYQVRLNLVFSELLKKRLKLKSKK